MMMQQEEQISRYFDHAMNSAEEQNFLITLAASDAMRIAFRSQLELMKAVRNDADSLRSVAALRDRTLTALGLLATAVTPFIEQELVRSARHNELNATPGAPLTTSGSASRSFLAKPKYALGTGLFLGFMSAVALMNVAGSGQNTSPVHVVQPAVTSSAAQNPLTKETIPASTDLHKGVDERSSTAERVSAPRHVHHAAVTAVKTTAQPAVSTTTPEVTTSTQAKMKSNTTINKPADDRSPAGSTSKAP